MASISGGSGDDTLIGFEDQHDTIYGLAGNDRLWGAGANDTLYGAADNDTLYGGISNDELFGGDQNDTLYGGNNDDTLVGGAGNDVIFGGSGVDTLLYLNADGSVGINLVTGGAGDLYGGDIEVVTTGGFNDFLVGTTGGETFYGGGGDDLFHPLDGNDAFYGGNGNDRVAYLTASSGLTIDLALETAISGSGNDRLFSVENAYGSQFNDTIRGNSTLTETLGGDDGIDMIDYVNATAAVTVDFGTNTSSGNGNDILSDFEIVRGSAFGDLLIGGSGIDTLRGEAGNDTVRGGLGNDIMDGGLGIDTLDYSTAPSGVTVDLGFGSATGGAGNDLFFPDFEVLVGSAAGDRVTIGSNPVTVFGGGGGDSIYGGSAGDWISGGIGSDFLYGGLGRNTVDFSDATGQVILDLLQRTATLASGNDVVWNDFQVVIGSDFGDQLSGNADNDTMYGGGGNDNMQGVFGTDTLFGGAGNDTYIFTDTVDLAVEIAGEGTADHVVAAFNHTLSAEIELLSMVTTTAVIGVGNAIGNTIYGGSANNTLYGGGGIDVLYGGAGDDTFEGGASSDVLYGGDGNDVYLISSGDIISELIGLGTADRVVSAIAHTLADHFEILELLDAGGAINGIGSSLADTLYGNASANALRGGNGNDLVYGNGGNDIVEGGAGNDTLYGGGGHDTFDYSNGFTTGETINLSAGTVFGSHGIDTLGADFEVVLGSVENSTIIGTAGTTLYGGGGNDVLSFGTGGMYGGAGNDLYHVDGSTAAFVFEASGEGTQDTMLAVSSATLADNVEVLQLINAAVTGVGTGANDSVFGGDADNLLYGLGGDDRLMGGQGNDLLFGGDGNDMLTGNAGNDSFDGGAGNDTVSYLGLTPINVQLHTQLADAGVDGGFDLFTSVENAVTDLGDDQIWGNDVGNFLSASFGNDWLHGFLGNDTLLAGSGNDRVLGGGGTDVLYGDTGDDYFWFDTADVVFGGLGIDYAYNTDTTGVSINLATSELEGVWANMGADLLDASFATWSVQLIGYGSGDTLRGGSGNDYIWFDELDTVTGGGGLDAAYATTANGVTVNYATQGIEQVWATNANDLLDASGLFSHGNYMVAYAGTDTVLAGSGNDYIWIDWDSSDIMYGGPGRDEMYQIGSGALSLDLNAQGVEAVLGSNQGDVLNGTTQTQWLLLLGQGGNDTLTGSVLNDHLYGGTDNDTFVYTSISGGRGTDAIHDFATGDRILATGNNVVTGLGTATAVLSDGSTLVSDNGHNWIAGDFV